MKIEFIPHANFPSIEPAKEYWIALFSDTNGRFFWEIWTSHHGTHYPSLFAVIGPFVFPSPEVKV